MKKVFLILIATASMQTMNGQARTNVGGGYFGNTLTYPGVVLEYEHENTFNEHVSIPLRFNAGAYYHPRYNTGIFTDVTYGFRRYYDSGIFLEQGVGLGVLMTFLNSDEVYQVEQDGTVVESSRYTATDLMPSLKLGIGYDLSKEAEKRSLIWMRPSVFWQYPHKTSSLYSFALSIGYTFTIS